MSHSFGRTAYTFKSALLLEEVCLFCTHRELEYISENVKEKLVVITC